MIAGMFVGAMVGIFLMMVVGNIIWCRTLAKRGDHR